MSSLRTFLSIFTEDERRRLLWVTVVVTIGVGLEAVTLSLIAPASSFIMGEGREQLLAYLPRSMAEMSPTVFVSVFVGAGVLFVVVKNLYVGFQIRYQLLYVAAVKSSVSYRLFKKYIEAPYSFHLTRNSSELIRNVINEVNELEIRIIIPWMLLLSEGLVAIGLVLVLLYLNPTNTIAVGGLLGFAGLAYILLTRGKVGHWGRLRLESEEKRIRQVQQTLGGIKEVKLIGLEQQMLDKYKVENDLSARAFAGQYFFYQVPRLLLEIVALSSVMMVVLISMWRGVGTQEMVTGLGLLGAAAFRLLPSVNRIISSVSSLRFGSASLSTIADELKRGVSGSSRSHDAERGNQISFREKISVNDVTFSYQAGQAPVLKDISLEIPRNAFIGIVGESGSGKSTLVDLILGLLTPDCGQVLVDGVPIGDNLRSWQDRLAYVPQNIFLTDSSIRENIAFGVSPDEIDDKRVAEVLELAHVSGFIKELPDGIETTVGERGVRLSGGQCQRIGIARALYRDPEVVVFDEATSALDDESQEKVMEAIRGLIGSRTIITISHRMSAIDYCDLIFEVKDAHCSVIREYAAGNSSGKHG